MRYRFRGRSGKQQEVCREQRRYRVPDAILSRLLLLILCAGILCVPAVPVSAMTAKYTINESAALPVADYSALALAVDYPRIVSPDHPGFLVISYFRHTPPGSAINAFPAGSVVTRLYTYIPQGHSLGVLRHEESMNAVTAPPVRTADTHDISLAIDPWVETPGGLHLHQVFDSHTLDEDTLHYRIISLGTANTPPHLEVTHVFPKMAPVRDDVDQQMSRVFFEHPFVLLQENDGTSFEKSVMVYSRFTNNVWKVLCGFRTEVIDTGAGPDLVRTTSPAIPANPTTLSGSRMPALAKASPATRIYLSYIDTRTSNIRIENRVSERGDVRETFAYWNDPFPVRRVIGPGREMNVRCLNAGKNSLAASPEYGTHGFHDYDSLAFVCTDQAGRPGRTPDGRSVPARYNLTLDFGFWLDPADETANSFFIADKPVSLTLESRTSRLDGIDPYLATVLYDSAGLPQVVYMRPGAEVGEYELVHAYTTRSEHDENRSPPIADTEIQKDVLATFHAPVPPQAPAVTIDEADTLFVLYHVPGDPTPTLITRTKEDYVNRKYGWGVPVRGVIVP